MSFTMTSHPPGAVPQTLGPRSASNEGSTASGSSAGAQDYNVSGRELRISVNSLNFYYGTRRP